MVFSHKCKVKEEMTQSFRDRSKQGLPSPSQGWLIFHPATWAPATSQQLPGLGEGWALTWDVAKLGWADEQTAFPWAHPEMQHVNLGTFVIILPHSHILTSLQWPQNPASPEHPLHELIWPAASDCQLASHGNRRDLDNRQRDKSAEVPINITCAEVWCLCRNPEAQIPSWGLCPQNSSKSVPKSPTGANVGGMRKLWLMRQRGSLFWFWLWNN